LASCNSNNNIQIYNLNDGSLIKTLTGHSDWVRDLVQIKNTNLLASSSDDRTIRIWDLNTNTTKFILNGHTDNVYGLKQVTGDLLSSGSYDNTVRLWNITSGTLLRNLSHTYWIWYSVDVLSDGQTVVSGSIAQVIKLWNVQNGQTLNTFNTGSTINSLAVIKQTSSAISKK
jgi:WD40 repeat protein